MKNFLKFTALSISLLTSIASAEELKFANFMAPTHPYVAGAFEPFAKAVSDGTSGAVTVKLYNGGELGAGPVEQYSRVVDGVAELAVSLPGYTASNFPLTLLTELPGVIEENTGTETIWKNIALLEPEYKRVKLVSLWSSAENILFSRSKAVHSIDDVKGMKIRVPSRNTGLLVEAWGATPVSMPVSEIYNALQTGVIDAAMIDGTAVNAFKLGEVATSITMGMKTTISPFFIVMNRDAFDGLTLEQQKAVEAAGVEASKLGQNVQLTVAAKGIEAFGATAGKEVIKLSDAEAAPFNAAADATVAKAIAEVGGNAQMVVDAMKAK